MRKVELRRGRSGDSTACDADSAAEPVQDEPASAMPLLQSVFATRFNREETKMKFTSIRSTVTVVALLAALGGIALAAQDKYALQVPGGLAFSEFRGYDEWQTVAVSQNGDRIETILGNPTMIEAYKAGIPGNGKPFPDGARIAKTHWVAKKRGDQPGDPVVAGALHDVDLMVKDSKRFADSGGWGYAEFEYDAKSDTFRPGTLALQLVRRETGKE